ncbi:MAG: hypothetical protein JXB36_13100 [Gammaproteobacteria bacterium]|nr:hypothetical protein [Gammaproteobacteria bacterium]
MNVAYDMDFDIEDFLKSMERRARAAAQRRAGRAGPARRGAVHDRNAKRVEKDQESEAIAHRPAAAPRPHHPIQRA